MIYDNIQHLSNYKNLSGYIQVLVDFIEKSKPERLEKGRFEIVGDLFGIVLEYETKEEKDGLWEAHRKYIDMHYVLSGSENVHISNVENMQSTKTYDDKDDYELFSGTKEKVLTLKENEFLFLYPHEVHKTSVLDKAIAPVRKIVFKIPMAGK